MRAVIVGAAEEVVVSGAGASVSIDEGAPFNLVTAAFDSPTAAEIDWGDGTVEPANVDQLAGTVSGSHPYADNGSHTAVARMTEPSVAEIEINVTVNNVAPTVDSITVPTAPIDVGAQGGNTVDVIFSDPAGANDNSYTCEFDMDFDGATFTADETVTGVSYNACSTSLSYAEPGVYTVKVIVTDKDGGSGMAEATDFIVIYDPAGGFVTGGGWIDSPDGGAVRVVAASSS